MKPKNPDYLGGLGFLYAEAGENLAEAESLCRQALVESTNKKDADLWDNLGWVYYKRGKLTEAIDILEKALAADKNNANVYYHLAYIYYKQNNIAKAKELLLKTDLLAKSGRRLKQNILQLKKELKL